MRLAIGIYPGFTALDAVGPYEVLSRLPDAETVFVAEERGEVRSDRVRPAAALRRGFRGEGGTGDRADRGASAGPEDRGRGGGVARTPGGGPASIAAPGVVA